LRYPGQGRVAAWYGWRWKEFVEPG
jgi:hypothetical protein